MIGEEPYRWLEAIQNRREYIEDQMRTAQPVVALAAPPGIVLLTVRRSTPKIFEIYDRLALAGLGHPADIEKVRLAAIDAAHVEGFTRSPQDVSARRLVNYTLAPAMKGAFEQIFAPPLIFRGILAELGREPGGDQLWWIDYDGAFHMAGGPGRRAPGMVAAAKRSTADAWNDGLGAQADALPPDASWDRYVLHAARLMVWALRSDKDERPAEWQDVPERPEDLRAALPDELDIALLDRAATGSEAFRRLAAGEHPLLEPSAS